MHNPELLESLLRKLPMGACIVDAQYQIVFWNDFFSDRLDLQETDVIGKSILEIFPEQARFLKKKIHSVFILKNESFSYWEQRPHIFEFQSSRPITGEETLMYQNMEVLPLMDEQQEVQYVCITIQDVTAQASYYSDLSKAAEELDKEHKEQARLIRKLEEAKTQLVQSEKMASIGQLAAGVAHEINSPIGFIYSNLQSLQDYAEKLIKVGTFAAKLIDKSGEMKFKRLKNDFYERAEFDYIKEDIVDLISESLDGAVRVKEIVKSLKEFSHSDTNEWAVSDVVEGIESTLKIINSQFKYKVELVKDYQEGIPPLYCMVMQLNQVFMNLILNAAQAIEGSGHIYIRVYTDGDWQKVSIRDTGQGISPSNLSKIFDPFFTTKPVGSGTGLGLSLSYNIIKNHGGNIDVNSTVGKGTEFIVSLPHKSANEPTESPES
ncbi:ATP-binding protein [Paraglaciecola sp.]|uniref:PAS domain-containing sensor histidine kinase n=1 Tax=Paraglaciecola sp. TaxID=1920173 RepID=UPI00273DCD71|nr:ATP-binding protein [Paraglaciecola sp.]MDP5033238.1 ATP-binding protein [Paraglaciecola sp.]